MQGTILTIDPEGKQTIKEVHGEPSLDLLKAAIGGGLIEVVPMFTKYPWGGQMHDCVVFCDEEGKLHGQPFNQHATLCWDAALKSNGHGGLHDSNGFLLDVLVGQIAVVWGDANFMRAL